MTEEKKEKPFTFVDKRRRSEEEAEEPEKSAESPLAEPGEEAASGLEGEEAPPMDFSTFIFSLTSSAAYHMGGFQDPVSGKTSVNLDLAKQTIDIIAMLQEKTKGNLTDEESKLMTQVLYDLRMQFVQALKKESGSH